MQLQAAHVDAPNATETHIPYTSVPDIPQHSTQHTAQTAHMRVTLPTRARRFVGVCLALVVAAFSASAALAMLTAWRPRESAAHAAAAAAAARGGRRHATAVHSMQHSTAGREYVGSGVTHSFRPFRTAASGAVAQEESGLRVTHPRWWLWRPARGAVTATEHVRTQESHATADSVSWTGRAASGSIGSVRGHAWAHASGASATQGSPQPVRMAAMHAAQTASGTMEATWQLRRLQQGAAAGAGGVGTGVTVVATARQLQVAVEKGDPHIEIRRHLDLSGLAPLEPGGAAAAAGFESLALGVLPASVKSIRVRTPSMASMASTPPEHA